MARLVRLGHIASITQGLSTSGHAAGARPGDWQVRVVSVGDIQDDRLQLHNLQVLAIERNVKTEKHLLYPHDVLVTARSTVFKAALVPPQAAGAVADATLLVLRSKEPDVGPYLWWFVTSSYGRTHVQMRMTGSTTLLSLSVSNLADLEVPLPPLREVFLIADLVEASEHAHVTAIEAARLRRTVFRDAVIDRLRRSGGKEGASE